MGTRCHWACHWSYDTPANRRVYAIVLTLVCLGGVLILAGIIGGYTYDSCFISYRQCLRAGPGVAFCIKAMSYCKVQTWFNLILAGFIVIGVGLSFTVYFCFFSVPLKQNEYLPPEVGMPILPPTDQQLQYPSAPPPVMGIPAYRGYDNTHTQPDFVTATINTPTPMYPHAPMHQGSYPTQHKALYPP